MSDKPGADLTNATPGTEGRRNDVSIDSGISCVLDAQGHCITCSDEAQPALVLHVDEETGLAQVEVEGKTQEVDVTLVDEARPGTWLLVHGGTAIATIDSVERLAPHE